jgi:hypothetical protein
LEVITVSARKVMNSRQINKDVEILMNVQQRAGFVRTDIAKTLWVDTNASVIQDTNQALRELHVKIRTNVG